MAQCQPHVGTVQNATSLLLPRKAVGKRNLRRQAGAFAKFATVCKRACKRKHAHRIGTVKDAHVGKRLRGEMGRWRLQAHQARHDVRPRTRQARVRSACAPSCMRAITLIAYAPSL